MSLPPHALAELIKPTGHEKMYAMLLDQNRPLPARAHMLVGVFHSTDGPILQGFAEGFLAKMAPAAPLAELEKLQVAYREILNELEQGPVRPATFIAIADAELPGPKPRAQVVAHDGQERFPLLHPQVSPEQLTEGATVFLDAKGGMLLGVGKTVPSAGPVAIFVRKLPESDQIEVSMRDELFSFHASRQVLQAIERGEVKRGDPLLTSPVQHFAFRVIPTDVDRKYRFVDRKKLPHVFPHRDIGDPHPCLAWLIRRTRILMFRPDLQERFDLRPRISLLMMGPSGTGKTLTIKAFLTMLDEMVVTRTGREDIGSRVVRVKVSEHLSEWLGRSDKNFDRLFDDVQALAAEPVETASGEQVRLPVVMIMEEVEGIARRRSAGDHDGTGGVFDRILGTLLQRLDDPLDELSHLPLIIISTSNRPSIIDGAMRRRLGTRVARFGRLDRRGLAAVLHKKLKPSYPLASVNGKPASQLRQELINEVVANLFDPCNDEVAALEITLADGTKLSKFPRDFLSGAVVEQAFTEAIDELTFFAEESGSETVGLDSASLVAALRRQIDGLVANVTAFNASDYLDLPDHTHVTNVRRARAPQGDLRQLLVTGDH